MFPSRLRAVLLAAALAACAGDPTPTEPPTREPADEPRGALAPLPGPPSVVAQRYPFARVYGQGASAIALALPGRWCADSDAGAYVYELTPRPSLLLLAARSAEIRLSTQQSHYHRGRTSVREDVTFELASTPIGTDWKSVDMSDPGVHTVVHPYSHVLSPAHLDLLKQGAPLRVRVNVFTAAAVPPESCGHEIAGSQAKGRIYTEPYLWLNS